MAAGRLNVVILEPYYGGSHAAFADALVRRSRHHCTVCHLPARKWKWRMRGAALWFGRDAGGWYSHAAELPDVILANDMLSVADLRALLPPPLRSTPIVCYFHENQLTYPLADNDWRDYQYGMTNIISCLAGDQVWFNSEFHRKSFLEAAEALLRKMPDFVPTGITEAIREKSSVYYPPVEQVVPRPPVEPHRADRPLRILWCHRWEYDKNPEAFFDAMIALAQRDVAFEVVCTGEQFRTAPAAFADVRSRLGERITHFGYIENHTEYMRQIATCDLVVSTARQENFGIAVVEAMLAGCQPLLPDRLAYPELISKELHGVCLYPNDADLTDRLEAIATGNDALSTDQATRLRRSLLERFGLDSAVAAMDAAFGCLCH
ncbi:MAG: DUF3524 domain-containing protein [Phycisphaerae bacterium]